MVASMPLIYLPLLSFPIGVDVVSYPFRRSHDPRALGTPLFTFSQYSALVFSFFLDLNPFLHARLTVGPLNCQERFDSCPLPLGLFPTKWTLPTLTVVEWRKPHQITSLYSSAIATWTLSLFF